VQAEQLPDVRALSGREAGQVWGAASMHRMELEAKSSRRRGLGESAHAGGADCCVAVAQQERPAAGGGASASATEEDGAQEFELGELMARYRAVVAEAPSLSAVASAATGSKPVWVGLLAAESTEADVGDSAGSDEYFEAEESFEEEEVGVLHDSSGVGMEGVSFGAWCEGVAMQVETAPREVEAASAVGSKTVSWGVEHPDPPPKPFSVLFAGANVEEQTKLNLEEEFRLLRTAFLVPRGEESWEGLVRFERDCFATPSSVMDKLSEFKPTVLHLGCHGETAGVHLRGGFLENERLAQVLLQMNKGAGARRIRLVIANACMSGELALLLAEGIDFVIAHGFLPVGDAEAIKFSDTLYRFLGRGYNLLTSFMAASLESKPYELLSPRFDPEQFFFRSEMVPGVSQMNVLELVSFVAEEGVKEILCRVREDPRLGHRAESILERVLASDAAAKEWVSGISETASAGICLQVMADAMSDAETDETRSELGDFPESLGEPGGCWTILGVRHEGSVANFQQHMRGLVGGFVFTEQRGGATWSLCDLLLLAFMRHADFGLQSGTEQQWLDLGPSSSETDRLDCFADCLLSDSFKHPFLDEWGFLAWYWGCAKKHRHVGAVFVLDQMVRRFTFDEVGVGVWAQDVVHGWFDTVDDSQGFLDRANTYLGERASVMDMLGGAIETQSYCAFLVVSKLTALLFFEHLEARRRLQGTTLDLGGFRLFISSDRRVFGVAPRDIPSRRSLGVIQRGLRCLARLPRESLVEMLVPLVVGELEVGELAVGEQESGAAVTEKLKDHSPWAAGAGGRERAAIERAERVRQLYATPALGDYLAETIKSLGQLEDTITGDVLDVLAACVQLKVVQQQSVHLITDQEKATVTVQTGLTCPVSKRLMEDPVVCSDGKTYDRRYISTWFATLQKIGSKLTSPVTYEVLDSDEMTPNVEVREAIAKLKKEAGKEERSRMFAAEGEEERRAQLRRRGYWDDAGAALRDSKTSRDVMKLLEEHDSGVCIYGAPASGKTVSMLQINTTAASDALKYQQKALGGGSGGTGEEAGGVPLQGRERGDMSDVPRVPLFIRAAELSKLMRKHGDPESTDWRDEIDGDRAEDGDLAQFFIQRSKLVQDIEGAGQLLSDLYEEGMLLILVDGLDEGGGHRVKIENFVAKLLQKCGGLATSGASALVVSTREKNFHESVSENRLTTFARAQIQPLDEGGRQKLIEHQLRLCARADEFAECLKSMDVPDMVGSPFLLSLLVNVFKEKGEIPRRRDELYREQVLCVLRRAASRGGALSQSLGGEKELVDVGFEFLECVAFVCHMGLKTRDFSLDDDDLKAGLATWWNNERASLGEIEEWVFHGGGGALLCCTDIDNKSYRFGHLTVQEFLATSFLNRLSTSDSLFRAWINPVCDPSFDEVLRLASTMMDTEVFIHFSLFVLEQEDGSGAFCEVVKDMVEERGAQRERLFAVEEALGETFRSIRPLEAIVTLLSHPSADLRAMTLKEISTFPFLADVGVLSGRLLDSVENGEATTAITTTWMCSALLSVCQLDLPSDQVKSVFRRTLQIAIGRTVTTFFDVLHEAAVTAVATFFKRFGSEHEGFIDVVADLLDSKRVTEVRRKVLMQIVFDLSLVHERLVEFVLASWLVQPLFNGMDTAFSDWLLQIPRPTNARISALLLDMEEAGEVRADLDVVGPSASGTSKAVEAQVDGSGVRAGGDVASEEARVVVERDFRAGLANLDERMVQDVPEGLFAPLWQKMFNSLEQFTDEESGQLFQCVFKLDFPGLKIGSPEWDAEVTRTWRLPNLGRWAFSAILQHVRDSCKAELLRGGSAVLGVSNTAIAAAAKEVCMQQQGDTSHLKVEAELLLKELGIGRRAREIDAWSGAVSAVKAVDGGQLFSPEEASAKEARWANLFSFLNRLGLLGGRALARRARCAQCRGSRVEDLRWLPVGQIMMRFDICNTVTGNSME